MSTTISVERRQVLHKLIKEQHLETLSDEIQRDKSKITENFNVDELYALDNNGHTLLMTATEEGNIQMIRLLHKQFNASLNYLDKNQQSCVFYCVEMKNYHKSETVSCCFYYHDKRNVYSSLPIHTLMNNSMIFNDDSSYDLFVSLI